MARHDAKHIHTAKTLHQAQPFHWVDAPTAAFVLSPRQRRDRQIRGDFALKQRIDTDKAHTLI
jgi:hypothetical protein